MDIQITSAIEQIDEKAWDAVAGDSVTMTHRWQRVMGATVRHYHPYYLLLKDDAGTLATCVISPTGEFGLSGWREQLLQRLFLSLRGPMSTVESGVRMRPGSNPAQVIPLLESGWRQIRGQTGRLMMGINNLTTDSIPEWQQAGFRFMPQSPNMILDLPQTYEDYLARLSHKRRKNIRRRYRQLEHNQLALTVGPLAGNETQLYTLMGNVYGRHNQSESGMPFSQALFPALAREMSQDIVMIKGSVQGELAGFLLCLREGNTLWVPLLGLDYALARPVHLYYLLIDQTIRWAFEEGLARVNLGITNQETKTSYGFQPQARWFGYRLGPARLGRLLSFPHRKGNAHEQAPAPTSTPAVR